MIATDVSTRWMIEKDLPAVLELEKLSFTQPFEYDDFRIFMHNKRNHICLVAREEEYTIGYAIYQLRERHMNLVSVAVHPAWRLRGAGRSLVERMMKASESGKRKCAVGYVNEWNLDGQLFLSSVGFKALRVLRGHCGEDDSYLMVKRKESR